MHRIFLRMLGTTILTVGLFQAPALAQEASPRARLGQLWENSYLAANATLAELQKLKPQVAKWPPHEQAVYFSLLSKVTRETDGAAAMKAVDEEERIGKELGDDSVIANSLLDRAFVHTSQGEEEEATRKLEQARQLAEQTTDPAIQAKVTIAVGNDEIRHGNGRKGLEYIDRAVALADTSGQVVIQFMALRARAYALSGLAGEGQRALKAVEQLKAKAAAIPLEGALTRARYAEWQIAEEAGQIARSREALIEVVAWLQKHHMDEMVPEMQVVLADMSLKSHDYQEALALSRESKKAGVAAGNAEIAEISQFNEGIALLYLGQLDAGRDAIEAVNIEMMDADALLEYARALEYVGLKELALQVYARATRKSLDASNAKAQLQKKRREDEERLREKDESAKEQRFLGKLRVAWSLVAVLAAVALAAVVFLIRRLRAANIRLKNSDTAAG
ncbi:hypothetical protein [Pseudoduganella violaceinigra]|uniref:hypothetical protein n=1 Tax=Pseudoduganella violaceinigra TaxID=246602 RepID=UPI0003F6D942|nr:hypothetical protein [Pseudoduganella violaceinigra]